MVVVGVMRTTNADTQRHTAAACGTAKQRRCAPRPAAARAGLPLRFCTFCVLPPQRAALYACTPLSCGTIYAFWLRRRTACRALCAFSSRHATTVWTLLPPASLAHAPCVAASVPRARTRLVCDGSGRARCLTRRRYRLLLPGVRLASPPNNSACLSRRTRLPGTDERAPAPRACWRAGSHKTRARAFYYRARRSLLC